MSTESQKKQPVREGQPDSLLRSGKKDAQGRYYPYPDEKQQQAANQPEFIDQEPEMTDKDNEENKEQDREPSP